MDKVCSEMSRGRNGKKKREEKRREKGKED